MSEELDDAVGWGLTYGPGTLQHTLASGISSLKAELKAWKDCEYESQVSALKAEVEEQRARAWKSEAESSARGRALAMAEDEIDKAINESEDGQEATTRARLIRLSDSLGLSSIDLDSARLEAAVVGVAEKWTGENPPQEGECGNSTANELRRAVGELLLARHREGKSQADGRGKNND